MPELLTIGQFARRSGLTVSTLRFYDECELLLPHIVDPSSGYRSYREDQLATALLIKNLRAVGMPITEVRRVLAGSASEQRAAVEAHVRAEVARLDRVRKTAEELKRQIDERDRPMKMAVGANALRQGIEVGSSVASKDPNRPTLQGLLIEARNESLRVVATDGYRMSVRDIPALAGVEAEFGAAVSAPELLRWANRSHSEAEVNVGVSGGRLRIDDVSFEVMAGTYPAYETILAVREDAFPAVVESAAFRSAIEATDGEVVQLRFEPGGVRVDGNPTAVVSAGYSGPAIELHMDRQLLDEALSMTTGPDIAIEVTDPLSAVGFRSADDTTSVILVMPRQSAES